MKTFVVTQSLAKKGSRVDGMFTMTLIGQEVRYDLVFEADYYKIDQQGCLCFWQYLGTRACKGITIKTNAAQVATLAPGQWEAVYNATDCEPSC